MIRALERFIAWSEDLLRRHARGDAEAEMWCVFFDLTAISAGTIVAVMVLSWWLP